MTNRASGTSRDDERGRIDEVPLSLVRHERRDVADDRRAVRQPELGVRIAGGTAATRSRSIPSWTVTVRALGMPSR